MDTGDMKPWDTGCLQTSQIHWMIIRCSLIQLIFDYVILFILSSLRLLVRMWRFTIDILEEIAIDQIY